MSANPPKPGILLGRGFRVAVVASRYNERWVNSLLDRVLAGLAEALVQPEDIEVRRVPGANEVPYVCGMLADTKEFDVVIALGIVIAGATKHHEVIAQSTAFALQQTAFETAVPMINGIIVVDSEAQAEERVTGGLDRGREFAVAALEMASLKVDLQARLDDQVGEDSPFGREGGGEVLSDVDWDSDLDDDGDEEPWKS